MEVTIRYNPVKDGIIGPGGWAYYSTECYFTAVADFGDGQAVSDVFSVRPTERQIRKFKRDAIAERNEILSELEADRISDPSSMSALLP